MLSKIIKEEFPANKGFSLHEGMRSILDDLFLFEVKTVKDFRELLNKQKAKVLEHQEIGFELLKQVEPHATRRSMSFAIEGIIRKMLNNQFGEEDGMAFFEKISRMPAGTVEKLLQTIKKKDE